jgi:hypothetical protein
MLMFFYQLFTLLSFNRITNLGLFPPFKLAPARVTHKGSRVLILEVYAYFIARPSVVLVAQSTVEAGLVHVCLEFVDAC